MADSASRAGTRYATPEVTAYVDGVHARHSDALAHAFATPQGIPAIQLGQSEGKFLELLVRLVGAKKIVEVGTLVGYSAIRMATALPAGGKLLTIEYEAKHAEVARGNLARAGLADRVEVIVGAGKDILPRLVPDGPFDLVFIDADKESYDFYGAWAIGNVRRGGVIVGDNAYLFGELLDDSARGRAMRKFHEEVAMACDSVCVPTPDGMVVGIKR
jgi:predicted O-methyltransferase YrrM